LALNLVGWAHACRADEFDVLREKWVEMLTGGSHLDLTDPAVASSVSSLGSLANSYWSTMDKSPTRTFLWADSGRPHRYGRHHGEL
jgi:hypothetical protein